MIILKLVLILFISIKCIYALNFDKSLCQCKTLKSKYRSINGLKIGNDENINFLAVLYFPKEVQRKNPRTNETMTIDEGFCTGVILNPLTILTTARCVNKIRNKDISNVQIGAGTNNLNLMFSNQKFYRNLSKSFAHHDYALGSLYDLGILLVDKPFELGESTGVFPACIQDFDAAGNLSYSFHSTGWSHELDKVKRDNMSLDLTMITPDNRVETDKFSCQKKELLCLSDKKSTNCDGDAGHPLLIEQNDKLYVAGLMSRILNGSSTETDSQLHTRCEPGIINAFTMIYPLRNFINAHLNPKTDYCSLNYIDTTEMTTEMKTEITTPTTKTTKKLISQANSNYLTYGISVLAFIVIAAFILIGCFKTKKSLKSSKSKASLTSLPGLKSNSDAKIVNSKSKDALPLSSLKSNGGAKSLADVKVDKKGSKKSLKGSKDNIR